jgi:hypothetical protein
MLSIFLIIILIRWLTKSKSSYELPEDAYGEATGYPMSPNYPGNYEKIYGSPTKDIALRDMHPVLAYQYLHKGIDPANLGDPIRIPEVAGPRGAYHNNYEDLLVNRSTVPIQMNMLKETNERYNSKFYKIKDRGISVPPFGNNTTSFRESNINIGPPESPYNSPSQYGFPTTSKPPMSHGFFKPYGPFESLDDIQFIGSVNAYAPFPEVNTPWEKCGLLTSVDIEEGQILNLFRRPIAPLQDLWQYSVQDKDNFIIQLREHKLIENGDIIPPIVGKEKYGAWKATIFVQNKYIWN